MIRIVLGRPGGREGFSTGSSRRGKIWKEEGGRILLRVEMWQEQRLGEREVKDLLGTQ